ncbi:MAG: hypothetical protein WDN50_05040 [Bradyrhizobium sp.]
MALTGAMSAGPADRGRPKQQDGQGKQQGANQRRQCPAINHHVGALA